MNELSRCYLDNELWHCDSQVQQFIHPDDSKNIISFAVVENIGAHVANLKIVTIKGYPYYHDERLKGSAALGARPAFSATTSSTLSLKRTAHSPSHATKSSGV